MPKKSRKRRTKRRMRMTPKPLAVKEVNQRPQVLPPSPKQASVAKSPATMAEYAARHRYVRLELRRSLTIAAVLFVLLIVLYFLLR
jgi:hypothetical protein